jgi:hypothetical protein
LEADGEGSLLIPFPSGPMFNRYEKDSLDTDSTFGAGGCGFSSDLRLVYPTIRRGYNYYQHYGNGGSSYGTFTPRYGGGYNFYRYAQ